MKVVYISFPLNIDENLMNKYYRYVLESGYIPINPISIIKQIQKNLDDEYSAINKRLEIIKRCDEIWIFQKEAKDNMIKDIQIAKLSNIPIRHISIKEENNKNLQMYKYKERLKEVNNFLYSGGRYMNYRQAFNYTSSLESSIEKDRDLSQVQRRYLLSKLYLEHSMFYYISDGYRFIWNLNNNIRSHSLYIIAMRYIRYLEWGNKKINLMKKMFDFVKYDKSILEYTKEWVVERIFLEIQNQAKKEEHSNQDLLDLIYKYEDTFDLVEVFLKD